MGKWPAPVELSKKHQSAVKATTTLTLSFGQRCLNVSSLTPACVHQGISKCRTQAQLLHACRTARSPCLSQGLGWLPAVLLNIWHINIFRLRSSAVLLPHQPQATLQAAYP